MGRKVSNQTNKTIITTIIYNVTVLAFYDSAEPQEILYDNRGVSHYRILPVSRDIGWPVQQLDYFRYIKQHRLTIELLYIGYNFKEINRRQLLVEESDKTALCVRLHLYTVFILCWPQLHSVLSSMSARGPFENNKILCTCL